MFGAGVFPLNMMASYSLRAPSSIKEIQHVVLARNGNVKALNETPILLLRPEYDALPAY